MLALLILIIIGMLIGVLMVTFIERFDTMPDEWKNHEKVYIYSIYEFVTDPRTDMSKWKDNKEDSRVFLKPIFNEYLQKNGLVPAIYNKDFQNITDIASGVRTGTSYLTYRDKYSVLIQSLIQEDKYVNGLKPMSDVLLSKVDNTLPKIINKDIQFPVTKVKR